MKKIFFCGFTALALAVSSATVLAADNKQEFNSFDDNREQIIVNVVDPPEDNAESVLMELQEVKDHSSVPQFFSYGSDYGFKDIENRSYQSFRYDIYEDLLEACSDFAGSYDKVNYSQKLGYYLDSTAESSFSVHHDYDLKEISNTLFTVVSEVYNIFRNDHPEYYWLSNKINLYATSIGNSNGGEITVGMYVNIYDEYADCEYREAIDESIEATTQEYIDCVHENKAEDSYSIAKLVHDRIIENVEYAYDENGVPVSTPQTHSIVSVLDGDPDTNAVCEGYAKTYQLLLNALGVENVFVTGYGRTGDSSDDIEAHAWNMVKLNDGKYYSFDLTWDDQSHEEYRYDYFAKGMGFFADHYPDSSDSTGVYFLYSLPESAESDYIPEETSGEENKDYDLSMDVEIVDTDSNSRQLCIAFNKTEEDSSVIVVIKDSSGHIAGITIVPLEYIEYYVDVQEGYEMEILAWNNDSSKPLAKAKSFEFFDSAGTED